MQTIDSDGGSFAALDQQVLFSLVGAHAEIQLLDGSRHRGLLEEWHADSRELELSGSHDGEPRLIPLSGVRCIQWQGYLAGAPTGTDYRAFVIGFRDGQRLDGLCLEAEAEQDGLHLCVEASDGSPRRLFVPRSAMSRYRIADAECHVADMTATGKEECLLPAEADYLIRDSGALRAFLERGAGFGRVETGGGLEPDSEALPEAVRLARHLDIPVLRLQHFDIDPAATSLVSEEVARRHGLIPVMLFRGRLVLAMDNPADEEVVRLLRFITGYGIEPCLADPAAIEAAIHRYYGAEGDSLMEGLPAEESDPGDDSRLREAELLGRQKPVVRLVNNLILDALQRRASDIHIRPGESEAELLFRIDGVLQPVRSFSKSLLPAMVARIKVLGKMDIADRRLPQDGQARLLDRGGAVDLRISTIPTVAGESVVIRLLDAGAERLGLDELGLEEGDRVRLRQCLQRSHGLILVTGPTGAGKTTSLYAALQTVRERPVNIVTVEDPVEYRMAGVGQIQVNRVPGYGFSRALRHILRHDPDVVMIGEIRDRETAAIAVECALTGHLVLSTLHTNDALSAISRLLDMGIEPYLVAAALSGVLAQRLVRRNCAHCREKEHPPREVREALGARNDEAFLRGGGCGECAGAGYLGREAAYELLLASPELKRLIVREAPMEEMRELALRQGMRPLTSHALQKARAGITSLEEVYRIRLE